MPNCRSIPQDAWKHAREALILYFSRRGRQESAEDLAQQTLMMLWTREDFEFGDETDFKRVCYGFARNILTASRRNSKKESSLDDPNLEISPPPGTSESPETTVLLHEVIEIARQRLAAKEWAVIKRAADPPQSSSAEEANRLGVRLRRARKKLRQLTGWTH